MKFKSTKKMSVFPYVLIHRDLAIPMAINLPKNSAYQSKK